LALERPVDWKAMEYFAEYGAWDTDRATRSLACLVAKAPGLLWHGYHVSALDDTNVLNLRDLPTRQENKGPAWSVLEDSVESALQIVKQEKGAS